MVKKRTERTPKKKSRHVPSDWKAKFCKALRRTMEVIRACELAHVGKTKVYEAIKQDADFRMRVRHAKRAGFGLLLECGIKRAKKKSDRLLIKLLEVYGGKKFRPARRHEHVGQVNVDHTNDQLTVKLLADPLACDLVSQLLGRLEHSPNESGRISSNGQQSNMATR